MTATRSKAGLKSTSFEWDFDVPVEAMWSVLADTARFNEAAGFPKHDIEEIPQSDGSVRFIAHSRLGLLSLEWEDYPQNWIHNRWFRHLREFKTGPIKTLCATYEVFAKQEGSSSRYSVEIDPANLLGRVVLRLGMFRAIRYNFTKLARSAAQYCRGESDREFDFKRPKLMHNARARTQQLATQIEASPYGHGLARRLAEYVLTRPDVDVLTIRPLRLARLWNIDERKVIELCLEAVKVGLLRLRWDLLCPRCQIGKLTIESLRDLPDGAHCSSCNIDFKQEFSNNVELAFHPSKAIRTVKPGEFCMMGPMTTPHIKAQLTVEAGEQRAEEITLPDGDYRIRTLEPGAEVRLTVTGQKLPAITTDETGIYADENANMSSLTVKNLSERRLTFILEELAWRADALTARRATTFQAFRDLFDDDVLRPGDDVEIDSITIMFTDLKGSTALYDRIGDPQAYVLVREHFEILGNAVRECNGSIVKMIGDAIMAVFSDPADGFRCGVRIHADIQSYNQNSNKDNLTVKLGLHTGRCISVTLNGKLDYYGAAANMAARLQGQSHGGDIVLSEQFAQDPAVRELIREYTPVQDTVMLKGFEQPIPFFRISAETLAEIRERQTTVTASASEAIQYNAFPGLPRPRPSQ